MTKKEDARETSESGVGLAPGAWTGSLSNGLGATEGAELIVSPLQCLHGGLTSGLDPTKPGSDDHAAKTQRLEVRLRWLEAELQRRETELRKARLAPRPASEWPGVEAERLVSDAPPRPTPASARLRIRAAVDAGWVIANPSREFVAAMRVLDHEQLWQVLHLDIRSDVLFGRLGKENRANGASAKALRERLKDFRAATRGLPELTAGRRGVSTDAVTDVIGALATIDNALELASLNAHLDSARAQHYTAVYDRMARPRAAARLRLTQLHWLHRALVADGPSRWTYRRLAKLVLASRGDFIYPPCPNYASEHTEDQLEELLSRQLPSLGKKR